MGGKRDPVTVDENCASSANIERVLGQQPKKRSADRPRATDASKKNKRRRHREDRAGAAQEADAAVDDSAARAAEVAEALSSWQGLRCDVTLVNGQRRAADTEFESRHLFFADSALKVIGGRCKYLASDVIALTRGIPAMRMVPSPAPATSFAVIFRRNRAICIRCADEEERTAYLKAFASVLPTVPQVAWWQFDSCYCDAEAEADMEVALAEVAAPPVQRGQSAGMPDQVREDSDPDLDFAGGDADEEDAPAPDVFGASNGSASTGKDNVAQDSGLSEAAATPSGQVAGGVVEETDAETDAAAEADPPLFGAGRKRNADAAPAAAGKEESGGCVCM